MKAANQELTELRDLLEEFRSAAKNGSLINPGIRAQNHAMKLCDRLDAKITKILSALEG